jgi:hypothetical protein
MIHSCHKAAQLISDAMDRRLSLWERFCLRVHLLLCGACRRYRRQLTILREAMKQNPDAEEANVTAPPCATIPESGKSCVIRGAMLRPILCRGVIDRSGCTSAAGKTHLKTQAQEN